ncbi:type VII secretion-associated protein [Gordonia sp. TBRC 11910]|uniref:Type VII secretion-associated protein n=1 Tax=Gordonia asplenii TaxID=2725283 RepID=A0A848KZZ1_9ACTN|nr:type VII secretion-associated protein [Gordonia asplenii]NMO02395.1 type VII secretion-associated protein [Gordonia asplenii]
MTSIVDLPPVIDLAADALVREVDAASSPGEFDAWQRSVTALIERVAPRAAVITVPTEWGRPRLQRLRQALAGLRRPITLVPRAIAVARSHTDMACAVCVVVERLAIPSAPGPSKLLFHKVIRSAAGWELAATYALAPTSERWPAVFDDASIVVVDDPCADVVEWLHQVTPVGRIVAVDPQLLCRYGADPGVIQRLDEVPVPAPAERLVAARPRRRRALVAAAVTVAIVAVAALVYPRPAPTPSVAYRVDVGRVSVEVPAGWQRSASDSSGDAGRAVFLRRDDGRRIIVVQTAVRTGSTPESVARSLANKIAQRGDDAVSEFAASMRVGGREVIGYREAPASGSPIAWYVLVERNLQVSIGCQAGAAAQSMQTECVAAVTSAVIR